MNFFLLFLFFRTAKIPLLRKIGTSALVNDRPVKSKFVMQSVACLDRLSRPQLPGYGEFGDATVAPFLKYLDVSQISIVE